jgi:hypothetical protein
MGAGRAGLYAVRSLMGGLCCFLVLLFDVAFGGEGEECLSYNKNNRQFKAERL